MQRLRKHEHGISCCPQDESIYCCRIWRSLAIGDACAAEPSAQRLCFRYSLLSSPSLPPLPLPGSTSHPHPKQPRQLLTAVASGLPLAFAMEVESSTLSDGPPLQTLSLGQELTEPPVFLMVFSAHHQASPSGNLPLTTLDYDKPMPSRAEQIKSLTQGTKDNPFDLLVIGGGATGTGVALDAVTRGLSTALVEREDFASGTSSRSTKLVHGGVRYLEKAVFCLDFGQLKLVYEALAERKNFLDNASYLSNALPIMTVCAPPPPSYSNVTPIVPCPATSLLHILLLLLRLPLLLLLLLLLLPGFLSPLI